MGAPVLRAALERADELHAALVERNQALEAAGYHAQVAVGPQSEPAVPHRRRKRRAAGAQAVARQRSGAWWSCGRRDGRAFPLRICVGILAAEPERISPSALLRPVFQDFLLSTSAYVGGPAEVAYFAQSAVLYERILGRITPVLPRFSATLIEPAIGELLKKHELTLEQVFAETPASLAQFLAAQAMPNDGKVKLAAAGTALDAELAPLIDWMRSLDADLGRSAETAASKMRYQMSRLRRLATNFQLQREASLGHDAEAISQLTLSGGRVAGAAARRGILLCPLWFRAGRRTHCASCELLPRTHGVVVVKRAGGLSAKAVSSFSHVPGWAARVAKCLSLVARRQLL